MTKPLAPCSKCKGEMSMGVHEPFEGEEGGLRVSLAGMPYAVCAQGHKRFPSLAFSAELMDLVAGSGNFQGIPGAVKKGLFRKRFLCPGCGQDLPESPTSRQARELAAQVGKAPPFKAVVEVPVFRCGGCGQESIRSGEECSGLALKATGHAFRSIDIHPT